MANHGDRLTAVVGKAADDCVVVGKPAIAMELVPAREQALDIVQRVGAVWMPGHEDPLPRCQVRVELRPDLVGAPAQRLDRALPIGGTRHQAERLDLFQEDADRFFEL